MHYRTTLTNLQRTVANKLVDTPSEDLKKARFIFFFLLQQHHCLTVQIFFKNPTFKFYYFYLFSGAKKSFL